MDRTQLLLTLSIALFALGLIGLRSIRWTHA